MSLGSWSTFYGVDGTGRKYLRDYGLSLPGNENGEATPGFMWGIINADGTSGQGLGWVARDAPGEGWEGIAANFKKKTGDASAIDALVKQAQDYSSYGAVPASLTNVQAAARNSVARGWGPLIGNPQGPLAGLQLDMATSQWFWQSDHAPVWATKAQDDQITLLNKQTADAAKAAADADAARIAQENAAADEAQAKQDQAIALAQQAADATAAINQMQMDQQQQQVDQQAAAASTALDLQAAKMDLQYSAQQDALEQRAAQADLDWAIAHPDEVMQEQSQQGYDDGGGQGYDDGSQGGYDDGSQGGYGSLDDMFDAADQQSDGGDSAVAQELYQEGDGDYYAADEAAAQALDQE